MTLVEREQMKKLGTVSSSPYTGSPTYTMAPVHIEAGYDPPLGTFVLIDRDEDGTLFHYGRIVQAVEENTKADPWRLQRGTAYGLEEHRSTRFDDHSPYRARVARVELLGELVLNGQGGLPEVREATLLPRTGASVFELPVDLIPLLLGAPLAKEGLFLGRVRSGQKAVDFRLPLEAVARHIAVVGRTGVGKSYAAHVLVEELAEKGIPVVSFDVLGDALEMTQALGGLNLRAGVNFKVAYSIIGLSEFLSFVPNLTRDQLELVALAYDEIFGKALNQLKSEGTIQIPLQELLDQIHSLAAAFGQGNVGGRAARRVEVAVRRSPLLEEELSDWPQKLGNYPIVNVYVGHLGQEDRNLIVGASARLLQILRRNEFVPPFVLLIDEAHLFLPGGGETSPSTRVIRELVRTARHDAIGIVLITQSPSSMDKQALLTCNTRIVFALDREDLRLISGMLGDLSEDVVERIARLSKGHTIVVSGADILRHPVEVEIRTRKTPEGAPTPNMAEEVRRWKEKKTKNSGKQF